MSMNRICRKCGAEEEIRINFGEYLQAERDYHAAEWCNCEEE